jgi:hypothetical protein
MLAAANCNTSIFSLALITMFIGGDLSLDLDTLMLSVIPLFPFKDLSDDEASVELYYSGDAVRSIKKDLTSYEVYDGDDVLWTVVECKKSNKQFNDLFALSYLAALEYIFDDPNRFPSYEGITVYSCCSNPDKNALIHSPYVLGNDSPRQIPMFIVSRNISVLKNTEVADDMTFYFSYTKPKRKTKQSI